MKKFRVADNPHKYALYERNMDDSSFNENQKSMEKTISLENQAFFGDSNFVTGNKVMATMPSGFRSHGTLVGQWEMKITLDKTTMASLDLMM